MSGRAGAASAEGGAGRGGGSGRGRPQAGGSPGTAPRRLRWGRCGNMAGAWARRQRRGGGSCVGWSCLILPAGAPEERRVSPSRLRLPWAPPPAGALRRLFPSPLRLCPRLQGGIRLQRAGSSQRDGSGAARPRRARKAPAGSWECRTDGLSGSVSLSPEPCSFSSCLSSLPQVCDSP